MTTTPRPIIGAETAPQQEQPNTPPPNNHAVPEQPLAKGLAPWDLLPSDLILVRRKSIKK
jgi:hypothetical protein